MLPQSRFFALVALSALAVAIASADLLTNGDFSDWLDPTQPTGWEVEDTTKARIEQCTETAHSPLYSARITRLVEGTGDNKGLKQMVPITANEGYTLTAWYYDDDVNAGGGIGITWRDSDSNYITHSGTVYTDSAIHDWQLLTKSDTAPANAAYADVLLRVYGFSGSPSGGVVFVDDCSFNTVGVAEPGSASLRARARVAAEPNPSAGRTRIALSLSRDVRAQLDIYDMTGSNLTTVHAGPLAAGSHTVTWDGTSRSGTLLPTGLYFAVLSDSGGSIAVCKFVLER